MARSGHIQDGQTLMAEPDIPGYPDTRIVGAALVQGGGCSADFFRINRASRINQADYSAHVEEVCARSQP